MKRLHALFMAATLALLAAPIPFAGATADDGEPDDTTGPTTPAALATGLVGVASGQVAYLHVSYAHPPEPVIPPEPVHVLVSLIDEYGEPAQQAELELWPGRSGSIELKGPNGNGRKLVRGAVSIVGAIPPDDGIVGTIPPDDGSVGANPPDDGIVGGNPPDDTIESGRIQATLEVVDSSSRRTTALVIPTIVRGFDPQP